MLDAGANEDVRSLGWTILDMEEDVMQTYQALLSRPDNVAKVKQMRRAIESAGGKIELAPPTSTGMVRVTLWLPVSHQPNNFFPDLPFYPF